MEKIILSKLENITKSIKNAKLKEQSFFLIQEKTKALLEVL